MPLTAELESRLCQAAKEAAANAYCPHSGLQVGAAVLTRDDEVFRGCNVESDSYGLTCCAERTALFSAVAAGQKPGSMKAIVVYTPGQRAMTACGACRQVISEMMPDEAPVLSICDGSDRIAWTVAECLPGAFNF
jgi:cytidine deaminase